MEPAIHDFFSPSIVEKSLPTMNHTPCNIDDPSPQTITRTRVHLFRLHLFLAVADFGTLQASEIVSNTPWFPGFCLGLTNLLVPLRSDATINSLMQ